jgi:transposase
MPAPLSVDLRMRIVQAYLVGEGSQEELAARFAVGRASVARYLGLYRKTAAVQPKRGTPGPKPKLDAAARATLRQLVAERPDATDEEYAELLCDRTGLAVGHATINRALHRLDLTRKKRRSMPRNATPRGTASAARTSRRGKARGNNSRS